MPALDPEATRARSAGEGHPTPPVPPVPPSPYPLPKGEGNSGNNSSAGAATHFQPPAAAPSPYPLPKGEGNNGNNSGAASAAHSELHAAHSALAVWAAEHVGRPWNATCRAALGWLDGRTLTPEEAVVGTPMTPFRGDYRCIAPVLGAFTPMTFPGNGRLVTLITHPEPLEGGRRRAIFRAYVEGTREGHFVSLDQLPCDGPMAVEAGRAIADGRFDALPGIVNAHLPGLGHAPAAWVKIADLRFFAAFRRSLGRFQETGDLRRFVRDTLRAIDCVYREQWIAFAPEPACFGRLREIAAMARPFIGKAWTAAEVVAHASPSPLTQTTPPAGERGATETTPTPPKNDRGTLRDMKPPFDAPRAVRGARSGWAGKLPRLCVAILSPSGNVSALWFDPANPLHLTPPYAAVESCRGLPLHRLARATAVATGADFVEAVREEALLRITRPLVGPNGRGDLGAWMAAIGAWIGARLRYGRDIVSWPGPLPPRILPLLARVALANVR